MARGPAPACDGSGQLDVRQRHGQKQGELQGPGRGQITATRELQLAKRLGTVTINKQVGAQRRNPSGDGEGLEARGFFWREAPQPTRTPRAPGPMPPAPARCPASSVKREGGKEGFIAGVFTGTAHRERTP